MVCLPREPKCLSCPVAGACEAKRQGRQSEFPVKRRRQAPVRVAKTLLLVERRGKVLLWRRQGGRRMLGFWELPEAEQLPGAAVAGELAAFRHSITNHSYVFSVLSARIGRAPKGFRWVRKNEMDRIPLSTVAKKALARHDPEKNWRKAASRGH